MTLGLTHRYRGKVRDIYEVGDDHLLLVASDRLSAFDVVMHELIPNKGRVLTGITAYWAAAFPEIPTALVSCDPAVIGAMVPGFAAYTPWHGRSMLVRKATMLPLECIVRARLAGQAFDEYQALGTVHHMAVPSGMRLTDAFATPMFTPSTKAEQGHDVNIDLATAAALVGDEMLAAASSLCLDLFARAADRLAAQGLILADTKFELGLVDGTLVVCDEVVTPDSSRLWPADQVVAGDVPPSFDKQPFRDWLSALDWERKPPPPAVPTDIVAVTAGRYEAAFEAVTGRTIDTWFGTTDVL